MDVWDLIFCQRIEVKGLYHVVLELYLLDYEGVQFSDFILVVEDGFSATEHFYFVFLYGRMSGSQLFRNLIYVILLPLFKLA